MHLKIATFWSRPCVTVGQGLSRSEKCKERLGGCRKKKGAVLQIWGWGGGGVSGREGECVCGRGRVVKPDCRGDNNFEGGLG